MASLNKYVVSRYENLKGIDFSSHPSLVDSSRSPYCINMMPDASGNPEKRPGWETVYKLNGRVNNVWFCTIDGIKHTLCHCGDKLYLLGDEIKVLREGINDTKGCGFYALKGDKAGFYILTGREYLVFDGEKVTDVTEDAYVPVTTIARMPSGAGESYENINMLSAKRKEYFTGTRTDLVYQLGTDNVDSVDKIEILEESGERTVLVKQQDYTADLTLGKITFVKAHPTALAGQDNIFVTYTKKVEGYEEKITGCTVFAMYGYGGENRVFISGNKACAHKDFWSEIYDPSYFADLNYSIIGSPHTAVKGYLKMGEHLGVVKNGNGQDTTLFIRSSHLDSDGRAVFTVQAGISEIGAVNGSCFATVNDEPLFLSPRGVYAVISSLVTSQRMIVNRSAQVDAKLTAEKNIDNAVGCVWKDYYIISVNGNCYLFDSRSAVTRKNSGKNAVYESYFWNNIWASCITTDGETLWFGTENGEIRKFKDTAQGMKCYSDDDAAIYAVWKTPVEDEGRPDRFKTLMRKGCLVTLKPYEMSSCDIYYSVDGVAKEFVQTRRADMSVMFKGVNFHRTSFNTNPNPRDVYFYKRKKRYKRIQLVFENKAVGEGFGIQGITKLYRLEEHSKNRR